MRALDSVAQVICKTRKYNRTQPFLRELPVGMSLGSAYRCGSSWLVTCAHVVEHAESVRLRFYTAHGSKTFAARVLCMVPNRDVAILVTKCRGERLRHGDSLRVAIGDPVRGAGHPEGVSSLNLVTGVVSGLNEHCSPLCQSSYIQTTAPVNSGNSGGPLFDATGRVIGILTATSAETDAQNVGFAIPSRTVLNCISLVRRRQRGKRVVFAPLPSLVLSQRDSCYNVGFTGPLSALQNAQSLVGNDIGTLQSPPGERWGGLCAKALPPVSWSVQLCDSKTTLTLTHLQLTEAIPLFSNIVLHVKRPGREESEERYQWGGAQGSGHCSWHYPVPSLVAMPFRLVHGICVCPLDCALVTTYFPQLTERISLAATARSVLVITYVDPSSDAAEREIVAAGELLRKVGGRPVQTVEDFDAAMRQVRGCKRTALLTFENHKELWACSPLES